MFQIPKEMIPNKCIYTSYNCESKYKWHSQKLT
jgi:hypothetical protein